MPCRKRFIFAPLIGLAIFLCFASALAVSADLVTTSLRVLENRTYWPALKKAIDKAEKEIHLSFFLFKTTGKASSYPDIILASLSAAVKRGVRVVVLLEQSRDPGDGTSRDNRETVGRLRKMGVTVYLDAPETTTHTKLAVIDGRYTFIGSHNLTQSALKYNNEISVEVESREVAAEALDYLKSLLP